MFMPQADARHTCDMLIASLRESNLNFLVQETPFSAFITIRKTFCRGAYKSVKNPLPEENAVELNNLKHENEVLKNALEDKELQLESYKEASCVLKNRLERAEHEILKHFKEAKIKEEKLVDEISELKSEISSLKSKNIDAAKTIKAHEKSNNNLEKKNKHLVEQKNDIRSENLKLTNEMKALKKKISLRVESKTVATQTEARQLQCLCLDNNNSIATLSVLSTSTQTTLTLSDLVPTDSTLTSSSIALNSFKCLICAETCETAGDLVEHVNSEHDVSIDAEKLTDPNEEDDFLRFLKSMNIEEQYLKERVKYYPKNCDHIYERIKIRIIAQIKFLSHSKAIERNMENDDYKDVSIKGRSVET